MGFFMHGQQRTTLALLGALLILTLSTSATLLYQDDFNNPTTSYTQWSLNRHQNQLGLGTADNACGGGDTLCLTFNGTVMVADTTNPSIMQGVYRNTTSGTQPSYANFSAGGGLNISFDWYRPNIAGDEGIRLYLQASGAANSTGAGGAGEYDCWLKLGYTTVNPAWNPLDCSGWGVGDASDVTMYTGQNKNYYTNNTNIAGGFTWDNSLYHIEASLYPNNTIAFNIYDLETGGYVKTHANGTYYLNLTPLQQGTSNISVQLASFTSGTGSAHNITWFDNLQVSDFTAGGGATGSACSDGTANQTCSTTNQPYLCSNTTTTPGLVYDPNTCTCPFGQTPNGVTCQTLPDQAKVQTPVDLTTWGHGVCYNLGPFTGTEDECARITNNPLEHYAPGTTTLQAKYTARTDKRTITNQTGLSGTLKVTTVTCNETYTGLTGTTTLAMAFDNVTGYWEGFHHQQVDVGGNATIQCTSSIPNSYLSAQVLIQNVRVQERALGPVARAGWTQSVLAQPNRADVQDAPIAYTYETKGSSANYYLISPDTGSLFTYSGAGPYSAQQCLLTLENTTVFSSTTGATYTTTTAPKSSVDPDGSTFYTKIVNNNPRAAGDYPYRFNCVSPNRQPSMTSRESLTVNASCTGQVLTSSVTDAYSIAYVNSTTNVSTGLPYTYYYGISIAPSVAYRTLNGSAPFANTHAACQLDVTNTSGTLATFTATLAGQNWQFPPLTFPYTNGYLPAGSYNFTYTCRNTDRLFCAAPASTTRAITITTAAGNCAGTPNECGLTSPCNTCDQNTATCEDGQTITLQGSCRSQTCSTNANDVGVQCKTLGHDLYTVHLTLPQGLVYSCGTPNLQLRSNLNKLDYPATGLTAYCRYTLQEQYTKRVLSQSELITTTTPETDQNVSFSNVPCGQYYTASVSCSSSVFNSTKTDEIQNVYLYPDNRCLKNGVAIQAGKCASTVTGRDSDNPDFCDVDGHLIAQPNLCGCPAGQVSNSSSLSGACISVTGRDLVDSWTNGILLAIFSGGALLFLYFVWPPLNKLLTDLGFWEALSNTETDDRRRRPPTMGDQF